MRSEIARDIERKVIGVMEDTLRREMEIAKLVLEPAEIGLLMMSIAKGALTSAAGTIAGMAEGEKREQMFNYTIDQVVSVSREYWPAAEKAIAKLYAGKRL